MKKIKNILNEMTVELNAQLILLTTTKGEFLTLSGTVQSDKIESLCSLSVAQMAASSLLAKALEIKNSFSWVIREGKNWNLFLGTVTPNYILLLMVPAYMPLGVVRYVLNQKMPDLIILLTGRTLKPPISSRSTPFAMKLQQKINKVVLHPLDF